VALIGAGAMGLAITERLLAGGCSVHVRDVVPTRTRLARAAGASVMSSPAAAARDAGVVVSVVVDAAQTDDVLFGADGVATAARPGTVVLLCSTLGPAVVVEIGRRLARQGLLVIDAPMSGGPARARAGTMSMMIAGAPAALRRASRVLEIMSDRRFDFGERVGDAAAAKVVNNLLAGANLAAAAEGLTLGLRLGLDADRLLDLVAASSGQSWIGEERMRRAIRADYAMRASPSMLAKDLGLAIDAAAALHVPTPVASATRGMFLAALAHGFEQADDAILLEVYARMAGTSATSRPTGARSGTRRGRAR